MGEMVFLQNLSHKEGHTVLRIHCIKTKGRCVVMCTICLCVGVLKEVFFFCGAYRCWCCLWDVFMWWCMYLWCAYVIMYLCEVYLYDDVCVCKMMYVFMWCNVMCCGMCDLTWFCHSTHLLLALVYYIFWDVFLCLRLWLLVCLVKWEYMWKFSRE